MIIDLEVLNSVDHITSDSECVSVSVSEPVSRRISMRNLGLEYLGFHHSNKYKYK